MPVSAVNTPLAHVKTETKTAAERAADIRNQFLKILITEMGHQDPFNPVDNNQFVNQMAQIQQLESSASLTDGIKSLTKSQEIAAASAMIGKIVRGQADDGSLAQGQVDRVTINGDKIRLLIGDQSVALANVSDVTNQEQ